MEAWGFWLIALSVILGLALSGPLGGMLILVGFVVFIIGHFL